MIVLLQMKPYFQVILIYNKIVENNAPEKNKALVKGFECFPTLLCQLFFLYKKDQDFEKSCSFLKNNFTHMVSITNYACFVNISCCSHADQWPEQCYYYIS